VSSTRATVPRTRGIALWEDLVIANLPDGRVIGVNRANGEIVWDKKVAVRNEFGSRESSSPRRLRPKAR
jgi:alcohol dehydrogenase (cytochrome c)